MQIQTAARWMAQKVKDAKMKINAKAKKLIINFCTSCLYPAMPFKTPILSIHVN